MRRKRDEIVQRYLALMGLADFADHYPKHLSGGMRQRLALARAYAVQPEFLLMDEPFGALDAQTRTAMQDLLLHVLATEGKTVLLITHSVDEAIYLSSRIVVVTARPARVRTIIDVPFAYPRDESIHEDPQVRRAAGADPRAGDGRVRGAGAAGRVERRLAIHPQRARSPRHRRRP